MAARRAAAAVAFALVATGCGRDSGAAAPPPVARPFAAATANRARLELTATRADTRSAADAPASEVGRFRLAASLTSPRQCHSATTLPDGRVLVVGGGDGDGIHQDAELYDPITDTWTPSTELGGAPSAGLMMMSTVPTARQHHSATLLPGSARVLVAGGLGVERLSGGQPVIEALGSCFVFDAATNRFEPTGGLSVARFLHLASALGDGRVLVACGFDDQGTTSTVAEVYDPILGTWSRVLLASDRHAWGAIATLPGASLGETILHAGLDIDTRPRLLVAGLPAARTERFDAASEGFSLGPTNLVGDAIQMASNVTRDGRALFAGGRVVAGSALAVTSRVELYDPTVNAYTAGPDLAVARYSAQLAEVGDGTGDQLVVGGVDAQGHPIAACEVWDARSNRMLGPVSLQQGRVNHRAVTLNDGRVLVIGGTGGSEQPLDSCEVHRR